VVETARYVLFHQRVHYAANYLADLGSRDEAVSRSEVDATFRTLASALAPFDLGATVVAEVAGMVDRGQALPELAWKASWSPTLPATYQVVRAAPEEDMLVTARVVARYRPIMGFMDATDVAYGATYRPRFGTVDFIQ
jgi:hypothetical protein